MMRAPNRAMYWDASDQGLMRRIVLVDDRGALLRAVVDDDVDLVAAKPCLAHRLFELGWDRHAGLRGRHRRGQEIVGVLLDVALDRVEVFRHIGQFAKAGAQLVHHQRDRAAGRLPVQIADRIAVLAFPLRHLLHDRFELALHLLDVALHPLALGLRQGLEHLRRQDLAVAPGRQRQPHRRAQQGDALLLGMALQFGERLLVALLELLVDDLAPRPVIVALEGRRQGRAQFPDQPLHRLAQARRTARRQLQAARLLRLVEVVDVAPVRRRRLARRPAPQEIVDQGMLAGAAGAQGIDVVALAAHGDGELDGLDRAVLADQPRRSPRPRPRGRPAVPPGRSAGRAAPAPAVDRARRRAARPRPSPVGERCPVPRSPPISLLPMSDSPIITPYRQPPPLSALGIGAARSDPQRHGGL